MTRARSPNMLAKSSRPMPTAPHFLQCLDAMASIMHCRLRQEICREGQAATMLYYVVAGAALRYVVRSDGRRQIVDFLFPGDFFGLTANAECDDTVEAVAPGTIVAAYPRKRVEAKADSDPQLARELRQIALDGLARLQEQLVIVGRITVPQKVGSFILAMADRLSDGQSDQVALPISRYDIADYLAVSAETVSRALSELQRRGLIRFVETRVFQILDRNALGDDEHDDLPERANALAARMRPQLSLG